MTEIIFGLILVALGILVTLRPKIFWLLWRGWMPGNGNREPNCWELLRSRVAGICSAGAGVFVLYWLLTHQ